MSEKESPEQAESVQPAENAPSDIYSLIIAGNIEGHMVLPQQNKATKYEQVIPQLIAIEQETKIKGLLVIINTVGGDVESGLAIAEMIASLSKPSVSIVLGGGHSIGVPIAVSCSHSFIVPSATMTIHPIRITGLIVSGPQTFDYLEKMQERIVDFITTHSRVEEEVLKSLMFAQGSLARDIGTNMIGQEAVDCGLIDEIGGLSTAIQKLHSLIASI